VTPRLRRRSDGAPFGAWLFKCSPGLRDFDRFLAEPAQQSEWCVTRTYRSDLMEAHQPALLWVSGNDRGHPVPGIWGVGELAGPTTAKQAQRPAADRGPLRVDLTFRLLADPLPRTVLRQVPLLEQLEVLRIPAGSNPSWVTPTELAAVVALIEQVD
jgi:hypothetical protein